MPMHDVEETPLAVIYTPLAGIYTPPAGGVRTRLQEYIHRLPAE